MADLFSTRRERLILPVLAPFYTSFAEPVGWAVFRILVGGVLVYEGWPKILAPFGQSGFVEALGFHPGWVFSPLLAAMQFFGGMLIAIGLLTRPLALANTVMLLVTLWFHYTHPFGEVFFTPDGLAYLQAHADMLTDAGKARLLKDGGAVFLELVQGKAYYASVFWAAAAALIAAFGGGPLSVDRRLGREF